MATKKTYLRSAARKRVARPQPAMADRRTRRTRDRGAQRRRAIEEGR